MESFLLKDMIVDQVVLSGADWIGFVGHRLKCQKNSQQDDGQFLEIFSQRNIAICLHTIKAERGSYITDVAVQGLDTLALANEDGSVTVKQLTVSRPGDSFIFDDVSH